MIGWPGGLTRLRTLQSQEVFHFLMMDVTSLSSNIEQNIGIQCVEKYLTEDPEIPGDQSPTSDITQQLFSLQWRSLPSKERDGHGHTGGAFLRQLVHGPIWRVVHNIWESLHVQKLIIQEIHRSSLFSVELQSRRTRICGGIPSLQTTKKMQYNFWI